MKTVLVDTCVILDILDKESSWHHWSKNTFRELSKTSALAIYPIIIQ